MFKIVMNTYILVIDHVIYLFVEHIEEKPIKRLLIDFLIEPFGVCLDTHCSPIFMDRY